MKHFSLSDLASPALLALAAALALSGCGGNPVSDNATTTAPTTTEPAPTPQTNEDERYRATSADDQQFGPDAPPAMIENYKKAMDKVHQSRPPLDMKVPDSVKVVMQTNRGPITLQLDGKAAPLHVKSFVYLARQGFFDGTSFHRHADIMGNDKSYIIQGGDPLTKDPNAVNLAGMGGPGYEIPREKNKLTHQKLVIAAARTQDPDSAGSQFYITQGEVPFLDQGDGYTVFGKVVAGREAALKLAQGDTLQSVKVQSSDAASASAMPADATPTSATPASATPTAKTSATPTKAAPVEPEN